MLLAATWTAAAFLSPGLDFVDGVDVTPVRSGGRVASWSWADASDGGFDTSDMTRRHTYVMSPDSVAAAGADRLVMSQARISRVVVRFGDRSGRLGRWRRIARGRRALRSQVDANARGLAAVAWFDDRGVTNDRVMVALRRPGGRFGRPVRLGQGRIRSVSVAVGTRGQVLVAWDARGVIRTRVRRRGRWGAIDTIRSRAAYFARLQTAFTPRGDALVGWTAQFLSEGGGVGPRRHQVAVRPAGARRFRRAQLLGQDPRTTYFESGGNLKLAIDSSGLPIVAWSAAEGVRVATADRDGRFGASTLLSPAGAVGDLATGPRGEALVVWERGGAIEASFRPAGAAFGPPEVVDSGHEARIPAAGFDAATGVPTVVWSHRDQHTAPTYAAASTRTG